MNKNLDFIQLNNFAKFHDGKRVFFCKTDFLFNDFAVIERLDNEVILISGNSDYPITDQLVEHAPDNIKKWYCQNAMSKNPILSPIPIGLENLDNCIRTSHGIGWGNRVQEKMDAFNHAPSEEIRGLVYANFNVRTNISHRTYAKDVSLSCPHIHWNAPVLPLKTWVSQVKKYKMSLCPAGNGIDTHRLWETLYAGRIPITIKIGEFGIYELYKKLPIIVLDNMEQLRDVKFLESEYNRVVKKDIMPIYQTYWNKKINEELSNLFNN